MEITHQQRVLGQQSMSVEQRLLYEDPSSGAKLYEIAQKYSIDGEIEYSIFVRIVGDVILGFYNQQDLLALLLRYLPGLNPTQHLELELDVKKFLLPLSSVPGPAINSTSGLAAEISATEHDLESLHNLRTMAHDMQEAKIHPVMHVPTTETTYQSSQADILRPAAPVPVVNETPRWDTE